MSTATNDSPENVQRGWCTGELNTKGAPAPKDHPYASACWLIGRHPQLARLLDRVPGVVDHDDVDQLGPDLGALAAAIKEFEAHAQAWQDYKHAQPEPAGTAARDRWRRNGPKATPAAAALRAMSRNERTRLRLVAAFDTDGTSLRIRDFRHLDAAGQALLADWCEAVRHA